MLYWQLALPDVPGLLRQAERLLEDPPSSK